jgi:hypothetical protein
MGTLIFDAPEFNCHPMVATYYSLDNWLEMLCHLLAQDNVRILMAVWRV